MHIDFFLDRKHWLASVAREVEFSVLMLSVSKTGYEERASWVLEGISVLNEDGAWTWTISDATSPGPPEPKRIEEAREITAIFSRV